MKLVDGIDFWPDQSMYTVVLPPKPKKCLVGLERKELDQGVRGVAQKEFQG